MKYPTLRTSHATNEVYFLLRTSIHETHSDSIPRFGVAPTFSYILYVHPGSLAIVLNSNPIDIIVVLDGLICLQLNAIPFNERTYNRSGHRWAISHMQPGWTCPKHANPQVRLN